MSFEGSDLDMPQPIHYSTGIPVDFRPEVLFRRPQLALHIALISYLWNEIEAKIGVFLAILSGNEGKTVISIFTAIQSDVAKRRIIDTIAELNLNEAEQTKFQAILKKISERYVERNRIVHGSWGISPRYPDKLLWGDARDSNLLAVDLVPLAGKENASARSAVLLKMQKKLLVYGEKDFLDIESRIKIVSDELELFCAPFISRALYDHGFVLNRKSPEPEEKLQPS